MLFDSPTQPLLVIGIISTSKPVGAKKSWLTLSCCTMLGCTMLMLACCCQSFDAHACADGEPIVDEMVLCADAPESDVEESIGAF